MKELNEKIPDPKELEKEIGDFLTKKFGDSVKIVSPFVLPHEAVSEEIENHPESESKINFDLKPEQLVAYLDQYIIKQDEAKAVLATKICTHFNRIKYFQTRTENENNLVGSIKNNILMAGPTGVGKTYMIKLIAKKIGVPFVKGDATKFSETGYVGGDVEDLVRDLVREANGNIELAQCGIIYIDEIDKIASSHSLIGADVSRTGVQRALLKPMEETEVEMKVPHDPISMLQEIDKYRKTGKKEKDTVNTKNILFIMSGAFGGLSEIIQKRITDQAIGFGAKISTSHEKHDILKLVKSEDLIEFGFESEFIGRLPIRALFERLNEEDLFKILKNPNNPIILGKKLDFASYGIDLKFGDKALHILAKNAAKENTGARGLVSAVEQKLLKYEKKLPSTNIKKLAVTYEVVENPAKTLDKLLEIPEDVNWDEDFKKTGIEEKDAIKEYIETNCSHLEEKYGIVLSLSRADIAAEYYCRHITDIENTIKKIKFYYDEVKKTERYFYKNHEINIVLEEDAIDYLIELFVTSSTKFEKIYIKLTNDFELGLKLAREKTGKNEFFMTREALLDPENHLKKLIKNGLTEKNKLIGD